MTIDVYTATGEKQGTLELPAALFGAPINMGLMHQAVTMQQSNRRAAIAHTKTRGEIRGSTRKLFPQKGTGRARRGSVRSPLLKGGNKAFGPKNNANFIKKMPSGMRRAALLSCLSAQAKAGVILGLASYPDTVKTKAAAMLLQKLPVEFGRPILVVTPGPHRGLMLSVRNLPRVKAIMAAYLNPEDILKAHRLIFLTEAIAKAEEVFGKREERKVRDERKERKIGEVAEGSVAKEKKVVAKRAPAKKIVGKPSHSDAGQAASPTSKTSTVS